MQKNNTKNINLYPLNNKFNNTLLNLHTDKFQINTMPLGMGINKYLFSGSANISKESVFIFNSSIMSDEIVQFISSFHNQFKILIFIDDNREINQFFPPTINISYIIPENLSINATKIIILPTFCIDDSLYKEQTNTTRINQIIHFLNPNQTTLSPKLSTLLYPASKLRIKLFDNPNLKNAQNLGYTTENEKQHLLSLSSHYLHDNNYYYVAEALRSGCLCLNMDSAISINDQIQNYDHSLYTSIINNTSNYNDLLERICYDE